MEGTSGASTMPRVDAAPAPALQARPSRGHTQPVPSAAAWHGQGAAGTIPPLAFSRRRFLKGKSLLVQWMCLTRINSQL